MRKNSKEFPVYEKFDNENIKPLFGGAWADRLLNLQELPVGGTSFLINEANVRLVLDFQSFDYKLKDFDVKVNDLYEKNKKSVLDFIDKHKLNIDPYLIFRLFQVQNKTESLLEVDRKKDIRFDRHDIYSNNTIDGKSGKLSDMIGLSECAEMSALGQYLCQILKIDSSYVGGIEIKDAKNFDDFPSPHSFLVIRNFDDIGKTHVFDIARPLNINDGGIFPSILETAVPFNYELLENKTSLFVSSRDILSGKTSYFGVGSQVSGSSRNII